MAGLGGNGLGAGLVNLVMGCFFFLVWKVGRLVFFFSRCVRFCFSCSWCVALALFVMAKVSSCASSSNLSLRREGLTGYKFLGEVKVIIIFVVGWVEHWETELDAVFVQVRQERLPGGLDVDQRADGGRGLVARVADELGDELRDVAMVERGTALHVTFF